MSLAYNWYPVLHECNATDPYTRSSYNPRLSYSMIPFSSSGNSGHVASGGMEINAEMVRRFFIRALFLG